MTSKKHSDYKDILILVFGNIFLADTTIISIGLLFLCLTYTTFIEPEIEIKNTFWYFLFISFSFGRLFVLPVLYEILENKTKNNIVLNFIQKLKQSILFKFGIILITFLPIFLLFILDPFNIGKLKNITKDFLIYTSSTISYIILFAYWFIKDITKKLK